MNRFQRRLIGLALWCAAGLTHAAPVPGQGTWESTLHGRDIDGNGSTDAYYDSALNVTWMADWNSSGLIVFEDALAWAANLTVAGLGGWRLPGMTDTGAPGCVSPLDHGTDCGFNSDTSTSELAHLFYVTLGNLGLVAPGDDLDDPPQAGWGLGNTAGFADIQPYRYWTGTANAQWPGTAWLFDMRLGQQVPNSGLYDGFPAVRAVAVRDGDVMGQPVPVSLPSSGALAALGLLLALAPRRAAAAARR
jgi:hypothetical protein